MALAVLICEDDPKQREHMLTIINDHIALKNYNMHIALCTDNPVALLEYVKRHPTENKLYFLDVHLGQHKINGIMLAKKIREHDFSGYLTFVTTHAQLSYLTFEHHLEAMDYIIKGSGNSVAHRVQKCVDLVYNRVQSTIDDADHFQVKTSTGILKVPVSDIIFFESCTTSNKKLILYTTRDRFEFRGTLKSVSEENPAFFHCHKSYILNTKNIKSVTRLSTATGEAEMTNGTVVPINKTSIVPLKKLVAEQLP